MQYVRNLSDSVSTAWNSINPATLSGAIDVIVVEQEDGTLACSPFHVRFGKFSLLRPSEKKIEFKVNGVKRDIAMKLTESGEAFFVFETTENIPQSQQTSPMSSPGSSPTFEPQSTMLAGLQEPDPLDLDDGTAKSRSGSATLVRPPPQVLLSSSIPRDPALLPRSTSPELFKGRPASGDWSAIANRRPHSDDLLRQRLRHHSESPEASEHGDEVSPFDRSASPPPLGPKEAIERALILSQQLAAVNIATEVTETGDLMLDMSAFKANEEDALRAEILARKVLSQELQGNYDVGALFGMDEQGNLWIYSSEEAKEAAMKKMMQSTLGASPTIAIDAASDPGYHSDDSIDTAAPTIGHRRSESDAGYQQQTPPTSPGSVTTAGRPEKHYAKTLRLTSEQLRSLDLKPGENSMSFTVNRATCSAFMYLWKHETPVVISDIDGTITKSDALGHVLNMIGRDWTHAGVAKLYCDIVTNGYNIMYLTSRSVGQADTTRGYLAGVQQGGYRLPRGPTILSPDRTMAALRREVYLRKPHVFKMATLRDIRSLYGPDHHAFYAGFGNRLTDQISYRTVDVPRNRIFTINSNAEVSLDLLSLNKLKLSYMNINEVVDHYFPPVSTLVTGGGENYTDFTYWRDMPLEMDEFSASDSEEAADSHYGEDEEDDEEVPEEMGDSYISRNSIDDYGEGSVLSGDLGEDESMMGSMMVDENAEYEGENEEGGDDLDDEHDQEEDLTEHNLDVLSQPSTPSTPLPVKKTRSKPVLEKDVDGEVITGVKNLTVEKRDKKQ